MKSTPVPEIATAVAKRRKDLQARSLSGDRPADDCNLSQSHNPLFTG